MRNDSLGFGLGSLLHRVKKFEWWLVKSGLPGGLALLPAWLLCVHYCLMMRSKISRIARLGQKMQRWLETVQRFSANEVARTELLDLDHGMRDDIECTKRTIGQLRGLCDDVGRLFALADYRSALFNLIQDYFMKVLDKVCAQATSLQQAVEAHDDRALSLLRQKQAEQLAQQASDRAHAAREAAQASTV